MTDRNNHIISLIEGQAISELGAADLAAVRAHSETCPSCERAFAAAQIAAVLLKEGRPETFAPPPFFQTKVLAAWRERQVENESWAWSRIWKTTGALASSMAATVAMLAILTFALPGQSNSGVSVSANGQYSAEEVILNESDPDSNQMDARTSDGQVLTTLYEADDDTEK
jgi:hypothetical protein